MALTDVVGAADEVEGEVMEEVVGEEPPEVVGAADDVDGVRIED